MRKDNRDAMSYIESAFLDVKRTEDAPDVEDIGVDVNSLPSFTRSYTGKPAPKPMQRSLEIVTEENGKPIKLKPTKMKAPRPRRRRTPAVTAVIEPDLEQIWQQMPKNLKFLASVYDDNVTQRYYSTEFRESREDLIMRMVDPQLNLEEAARLLGVCPATVRRYTNRGWLEHHRTVGNQRRFKLSGIVNFVEGYGRNPD